MNETLVFGCKCNKCYII